MHIAFYAPLVGLFVTHSGVGYTLGQERHFALGLFLGGLSIAALGIYDDLRGAGARKKFAVQFLVAGTMYFLGFRVENMKLFTFVVSAMIAGIAGALYVPQVGIINPSELAPANAIEIAIWVAVGGRGTLAGAALGALLVNGFKSWLTVAYPDLWLFFLGGLFVIVTLLLPGGVVGLLRARVRPARARAPASVPAPPPEPEIASPVP